MYQTIDDRIKVIGISGSGKFVPKKFLWKAKTYSVEQITLETNVKDGGRRLRWYSVVVAGTVYRLCFDRDNEQWLLHQVWFEG
ncbi:MAG: hypothetical protein M3Q81_00465 [bacterium]|nr:hypothetical protein [bacterium]